MIYALLALGALAALTGALARNPVAIALLASLAFSLTLSVAHVPYNFILWILPDLAVMLVILRYVLEMTAPIRDPLVTRREVAVFVLFLPIWAIYLLQPGWGNDAVAVVFSAQMLLTFPARRCIAATRAFVDRMREGGDDTMTMAPA